MKIPTRWRVRRNGKPTRREMAYRRAIHLLMDMCACGVVLMQNEHAGVYLIPAIMTHKSSEHLPSGAVEYQVSNGLPGLRTHSADFVHLQDAVEFFGDVVLHGWAEAEHQAGRHTQRIDSAPHTGRRLPRCTLKETR
jgi:hypothetical protein